MPEDSLFGRRVGNRMLICPECVGWSLIEDAGPGRAFCSGQDGREHPELEMVAYVREDRLQDFVDLATPDRRTDPMTDIDEMRLRVQQADNEASERAGISAPMMTALGSLPVTLDDDGYVPRFGPSGATLNALRKRGLAECDGRRWTRTALGESVWERR